MSKISFSGAKSFLQGLPGVAKGAVSALTVAGTVLGVASVVAPLRGTKAVALVAGASGLVSGLLHFLANPKVESVIGNIAGKQ